MKVRPVAGDDVRRSLAAFALAVATIATSQAQTLKTPPQPGLWESETQMLINGQDVMGALRQAQGSILAALPPEQRRQMEAMMGPQGSAPGVVRQCLSAKAAAEMLDPKAALANAMQQQNQCTAEVVSVSGDTVKFKGRCNDPRSFTGEFTGDYTLVDAKRTTYTMQGRGQVSTPAYAGPVEMQGRGQARWMSADCGEIKPLR